MGSNFYCKKHKKVLQSMKLNVSDSEHCDDRINFTILDFFF